VAVRALPIDVPASIEIDVSELLIGQHLTVESLVAVEGVTIIDDPQTLVVALVPPAIEEEEEEEDVAAEEASEQPEVIGDETSEE
jgi:large subunit ribosomal protein L25